MNSKPRSFLTEVVLPYTATALLVAVVAAFILFLYSAYSASRRQESEEAYKRYKGELFLERGRMAQMLNLIAERDAREQKKDQRLAAFELAILLTQKGYPVEWDTERETFIVTRH